MRVATSRINYSGPDRMDITVKSGKGAGRVLAPTWAMVTAVKAGTITWEQYTEDYLNLMRSRYANGYAGYTGNPFDQFMKMDRIVLCCYCNLKDGSHKCHRYLAAEVLQKIALSRGITFTAEGEVK